MIVKMSKYTFVLYHKRQEEFLAALQEMGLVDITTVGWEPTDEDRAILAELEKYSAARNHFKELGQIEEFESGIAFEDSEEAFEQYKKAVAEMDVLRSKMEKMHKEADELAIWGEFSPETVQRLADNGVTLRFFSAYDNDFSDINTRYGDEMILLPINKIGGKTYFVLVQSDNLQEIPFDAQEYKMPETTFAEISRELKGLESEYAQWQGVLARAYASSELIAFGEQTLKERLALNKAGGSGYRAAEDTIIIMEGWAQEETTAELDKLLDTYSDIVYIKEKPTPEDDAPVVLKNSKFANPFELIGGLYSLPKYGSLDLTAFFGPFYMIFFAFCLGDAGYGLVLVIASFFLRKQKSKLLKQAANLTLLCGIAAVVFGFMIGSFFGVDLRGLSAFAGIREKFLDTDLLFTLALAMGAVQIVFALVLKIVNVTRQFGFMYSLGTLGWLMLLLGAGGYMSIGFLNMTIIPAVVYYVMMGVGAVMMLFMNNPKRHVVKNFGAGLWDLYSNVTGFVGDMLSYIRLFALCLSGGTLALVFNDLAFGLAGGLPVVVKQLVIVIILLFGHSINIFMSALGAAVHPMRLTFVEFFKNSGFEGTLRAFEPLKKTNKR